MISDLYIKKTEDREKFVEEIMKKFAFEFKGKKVFVKPNIVSFENYPTTTHPNLLRKVLGILKENNCQIIVGDGPAPDAGDSEKVIKEHILYQVCQEFGIELINLRKTEFIKKEGLLVFSLPFESDYLISLPVLKPHSSRNMYLTGALKNHFGFLHPRERALMHSGLKNIHKSIARLHKIIKGNLFIVDAIETYKEANEERWGGIKTKLGYMLAGKDPVVLDCYGLELLKKIEPKLLNKEVEDIKHIKYAIDLGIGFKEEKLVEI